MDTTGAGDTMTRMLHALDLKDWAGVRREFADMLDLDYTSLFGGAPTRVDADTQVGGWERFAARSTSRNTSRVRLWSRQQPTERSPARMCVPTIGSRGHQAAMCGWWRGTTSSH